MPAMQAARCFFESEACLSVESIFPDLYLDIRGTIGAVVPAEPMGCSPHGYQLNRPAPRSRSSARIRGGARITAKGPEGTWSLLAPTRIHEELSGNCSVGGSARIRGGARITAKGP